MKKTAIAHANMAFIKYWGKKNLELNIPANGSISVNLDNLKSLTTVEFVEGLKKDEVTINGQKEVGEESRVSKHLDRIRKLSGIDLKARVVSENNYPTAGGLASSGSGFAALSVAASAAAGLKLTEQELSILARQGSGSAARSISDGIAEWLAGDTNEESYAYSLYPADYWDISAVVAVVSSEEKKIKSTQGHGLVESSPFYAVRLSEMSKKIEEMKEILARRDFTAFGELLEAEALNMHAVMLTSKPALVYWRGGTVEVMHRVRKWRQEGLESYFTIDAGPQPVLFCENKDVEDLVSRLKQIDMVKDVVVNKPGEGARLIEEHLF